MEPENYRRSWLIVAVLTIVLAFAFQGSRGLWEPDEGRYVRCAYEMVKTGDWVTPQINYQPHFTKPPMTYWLIASGLSLVGMNEWGARAFHGLTFALTALLVGFLGKKMWNDRVGMMACLIYATTVLPFLAANTVTTDTILAFFETLAVVCFWLSRRTREETVTSSVWALAMWFALGLAFLTKGPAGLLPLAAIIVYTVTVRDRKRLPAFVTLIGIMVFAVTALPWYVAVVRQHEGLLSYFFGHEVVGRIVTAEHRRNPSWFGPIKAYLPTLTIGAFPWAAYWPVLLRRSKPQVFRLSWWKGLRERPKALFLVLWFGIPLTLLSFSSSRLPFYVLPLFAALALATARGLSLCLPERVSEILSFRGRGGIAVALLLVALIGSKGVAAHIAWKRDSRAMWNGIKDAIHRRPGNTPYEIVVVHENYDGLEFYSHANVEFVTTRERTSPAFVHDETLREEIAELDASHYAPMFLAKAKHMSTILPELRRRGLGYSVADAPFEHKLILCEIGARRDDVVRLAAIGDAGTGDSRQTMIGSVLYHVDQDTSLDGILLLGDNIVGWNETGLPEDAYREYFEAPYAPLLSSGVPFYAALGNHDTREGGTYRQTLYPLFNMEDRRYYSRVFGDEMVEVFFLDSNTIKRDPQQVAWVNDSLSRSRAAWKVVALHHPIYSTAKEYPSDPSMIELLEPILVKNGVDLVLCGHNHIYERLRPVHGIHYITAGSGGKLSRGGLAPDSSMRAAGNDEENVALVLQFDAETCRFTAYGPNEEVVDQGKITHVLPAKTAAQLN